MNDRPASNHGVANIGQAKNLAKQALEALRTKDAIAATQVENDLVGPGKIIPSWDVPLTQAQKDAQHLPLLVGQLKAISAPFYKELGAIELPWLNAELVANGTKDHADSTNHYPWTKTTTDDRNKAFATIGQLKAVFSLRFETLPPPPATDLDRDGILDTWETIHGFNPFLRDEDHNGTPDGQDDADGDGSSNTEEQNAGTNPHGTTTTADHVQNFEASQFVLIPLDVPAATGLSDYEVNTITDDGKVLFNLYYIESGDPNDYNISSSFFWQEGISDPDRLDSSFYQPFRMFGRMNRAGYYSYQENFPNPADGRKVFMGHADSPVLSELTIPKFQAELDNQVQAYFQAVYSANWTSYSLERLTSAVVSTVDFHMLEDGSSFGEVWQSSDFRVTGTRATGSPSTAGVDGWATNCLKWIQTGTNGSDPQFFEGAGTLIQRSFLSQEFVNLAGAGGMGEDGFCVIRKIDHSGPQVTGQVTNSLRNRSGAIIKQFDEEESDQVYLPATSRNGHVAQSGSTGVSRYHAISGGMEVLPPSIQGRVAGVNDQGDVLVSSAAAPQTASPDRLVRSFLDDASGETTWAQCVFSDDKLPDGWSGLNVQALANSLPLARQRVLESEGAYPPAPEKAPIPLVAGTATKAGKEYPVLMLPVETVIGTPGTPEETHGGWSIAESCSRPSVEMSITSSQIENGSLKLTVHGTVRDALSRFARDSSERPVTLRFLHQDELLHSIAMDASVGTGFEFEETITIPNAKPISYVIRAETTANASGLTGFDEVAASLTWNEDAAAHPGTSSPISIYFPLAPTAAGIDQAIAYAGTGPPPAGTGMVETSAASGSYAGQITLPGIGNAAATFNLPVTRSFSPTRIDTLVVDMRITPSSAFPANALYGLWQETGLDTRIFQPTDRLSGHQTLKIAATKNLRGSRLNDLELVTLRIPALSGASGFMQNARITTGEAAYELIEINGAWYPEDPDEAGSPKLFLPSSLNVPARLRAPGYVAGNGRLSFNFKLPNGEELPATEFLVLPALPEPDEPLPAARPMALRSASPSSTQTAASAPWSPGQPVTLEQCLTAYRFIHANSPFALAVLDGYFIEGGHKIEMGDVSGDLDLDVTLGDLTTDEDNIWTIQIEEDENPVQCARLLFEGLKKASVHPEVYEHYTFEDPVDDLNSFRLAMDQAVKDTSETAIAATELYLSGFSILHEELDWIIIVNDVGEGNYLSLAGALPFIPANLVKPGERFLLRKAAGETLDALDSEAFQALREFSLHGNLSSAGTVYDEFGYSDFLRKALSSEAGPVRVPLEKERGKLAQRMHQILPRPSSIHEAHHDFPWAQRRWFANHGIDVNDPAYGRWVKKEEHRSWHGWKGGEFNAWWIAVEAEENSLEGSRKFTKQEIVQKLIQCREEFPDTP